MKITFQNCCASACLSLLAVNLMASDFEAISRVFKSRATVSSGGYKTGYNFPDGSEFFPDAVNQNRYYECYWNNSGRGGAGPSVRNQVVYNSITHYVKLFDCGGADPNVSCPPDPRNPSDSSRPAKEVPRQTSQGNPYAVGFGFFQQHPPKDFTLTFNYVDIGPHFEKPEVYAVTSLDGLVSKDTNHATCYINKDDLERPDPNVEIMRDCVEGNIPSFLGTSTSCVNPANPEATEVGGANCRGRGIPIPYMKIFNCKTAPKLFNNPKYRSLNLQDMFVIQSVRTERSNVAYAEGMAIYDASKGELVWDWIRDDQKPEINSTNPELRPVGKLPPVVQALRAGGLADSDTKQHGKTVFKISNPNRTPTRSMLPVGNCFKNYWLSFQLSNGQTFSFSPEKFQMQGGLMWDASVKAYVDLQCVTTSLSP